MRIFRAARFLFALGLRVDAVRLLRATVLAVALYVAAPLAALALRDLTDDVLAHRAGPAPGRGGARLGRRSPPRSCSAISATWISSG